MGKISKENDNIVKVTLPGYDISNATVEQCAIHSGFDYPKIEEQLEGRISVTIPNTLYTKKKNLIATIPHNYGYKPFFFIFFDPMDNDTQAFKTTFADITYGMSYVGNSTLLNCYVDDTNLYIYLSLMVYGVPEETISGTTPGLPMNSTVGFKYQIWVND